MPRPETKPTISTISTADTPPSLSRQESWMMGAGGSMDDSMSTSDLGLDLSLSTDQFSLKKSTASKLFYEQYNTPRSSDPYPAADYQTDENTGGTYPLRHGENNLYYSYPNIALSSQQENINITPAMSRSPVKRQSSFTPTQRRLSQTDNNTRDNNTSKSKNSNAKQQSNNSNKGLKRSQSSVTRSTSTTDDDPAMLFSQSMTLTRNPSNKDPWTSNRSNVPDLEGSLRFGNPRITYLTKIKVGDTVKLKEDLWKKKPPPKKSKFDVKGTIHYGLKSDIAQKFAA